MKITEELKNILADDISARFPYHCKYKIDLQAYLDWNPDYKTKFDEYARIKENAFEIISSREYYIAGIPCKWRVMLHGFDEMSEYGVPIEMIKPLLRPLSDMTDKEFEEWRDLFMQSIIDIKDEENITKQFSKSHSISIKWLNEHHFDYRGLIEKDLAIKITWDDLNSKKIKTE